MTAPRVFLDACVLFPPLVRDLVLSAAAKRLLRPVWSERVLDEWQIASQRKQGAEAMQRASEARQAMEAHFLGAVVAPELELEQQIDLPDPADAHVMAAAVAGGAEFLLTFNLRDFPRRALAAHGLEVRHPDGFLWELLSHEPVAMGAVLAEVLSRHGVEPKRARAALKRARLSRLGKAWEAQSSN